MAILSLPFQDERNFHILYELVAGGAASGLAEKLKVTNQTQLNSEATAFIVLIVVVAALLFQHVFFCFNVIAKCLDYTVLLLF